MFVPQPDLGSAQRGGFAWNDRGETAVGIVSKVYPLAWRADVRDITEFDRAALRAKILTPWLPAPDARYGGPRPSLAVYGFFQDQADEAWCIPLMSPVLTDAERLTGVLGAVKVGGWFVRLEGAPGLPVPIATKLVVTNGAGTDLVTLLADGSVLLGPSAAQQVVRGNAYRAAEDAWFGKLAAAMNTINTFLDAIKGATVAAPIGVAAATAITDGSIAAVAGAKNTFNNAAPSYLAPLIKVP